VKAGLWISVWFVLVVAACGSDEPMSRDDARPSTAAATTDQASGVVESAIVGRWERVHECDELVDALEEAGLRAVAAAIVAGDFFPDMSAAEVAAKDDLCDGASAMVHSHFFDTSGRFGSLDENENQVDEGRYEVIDSRTIRIGGSSGVAFNFAIEDDTLMLSPVLTRAMLGEALTSSSEIKDAVRAIAVAYPGEEWKRVPCKTWC
jgi:hypothetical protein